MSNGLFRDLRFGARLLRRNPGFTSAAVLSLALGIGGATAVFTLVNAIVLRTLPVPEPQQLYRAVTQAVESRGHGDLFSVPLFQAARAEVASTSGELAAATGIAGMQLQPDGEAIAARGNVQLVSGEFFALLRAQPQLGRLIAPSDSVTVGAHPVVVLSDAYWRRTFAASADAVGRRLSVNGATLTIIGVTRPGFFGTMLSLRGPDAWVPIMMQPAVRYASNASSGDGADQRKPWPPQAQIQWVMIFARVPSGARAAVATTMTMLVHRAAEEELGAHPNADELARLQRQNVALESAATGISGLRNTVSKPLFVLLAMVGVLLAIACGNVAGLLLSRAAGREREIAIRLSIGAARGRIVRQLIAESLLLACAGGLLGVTFALWGRDALLALMVNVGSSAIPPDLDTSIDWRVLAFSALVSTVTGMACGVLPALRVTRVAVADSLKDRARGSVGAEGGRRGLTFGKALVAAQMAFCLLLLVMAGLFGRSLRSLTQADVGFDRAHVLTARVDVRGAGYTPDERQALYARLIQRLEAVPGIRSAALSLNGPLANSSRISSMTVEGHQNAPNETLKTNEETVTQRYFDTVGLRILDGRGFTAEDRNPALHHSMINATMARRFFPGQSAVGKHWSYGNAIDKDSFVIVGVVDDAHYLDIRTAPPNMAYHLADATPDDVLSDIEMRTAGTPDTLAQTVHDTLAQAEPRLPVVEVLPLTARIDRGTQEDRMVARLTTIFGALALLLASLGLYGTISYGISRRVAELGLRMALGADRRTVLLMVMREALVLVVAGLAIGLPMAFAAGQSIAALLFAVNPADPWAFAGGAAMLLAVAALAAYLPAYRASRIEPMVALGR
jgi:predicted permease